MYQGDKFAYNFDKFITKKDSPRERRKSEQKEKQMNDFLSQQIAIKFDQNKDKIRDSIKLLNLKK